MSTLLLLVVDFELDNSNNENRPGNPTIQPAGFVGHNFYVILDFRLFYNFRFCLKCVEVELV